MNGPADIEPIEITDVATFGLLPPCADPRFDHRSCDYWEDGDRGSKAARPALWQEAPERPLQRNDLPPGDNPFAPRPAEADDFNPFVPTLAPTLGEPGFNPFAPSTQRPDPAREGGPRKLRLLMRGESLFGSYAKVARLGPDIVAYAQFGPLSAYPRAQAIRALYPRLPQSPLPAVITCVATIPAVRGRGMGRALVRTVVEDLAGRGFSAVEAYPDLTLAADEASAAYPGFWLGCGFTQTVADDRFPVMRLELE